MRDHHPPIKSRRDRDPSVSDESWIRFRLLEKQAELAAVDYELETGRGTSVERRGGSKLDLMRLLT